MQEQPDGLEWTDNEFLFEAIIVLAEGEVNAVLWVLKGAENWSLFATSSCSLGVLVHHKMCEYGYKCSQLRVLAYVHVKA